MVNGVCVGGRVRDICFCFKNKHLVIISITSMSVIIINDDRLKTGALIVVCRFIDFM